MFKIRIPFPAMSTKSNIAPHKIIVTVVKTEIDCSSRPYILHNQHKCDHDMFLTKTYFKNTLLFAVI